MASRTLLAITLGAAAVSAHGFVEKITVGGEVTANYNPTTDLYNPDHPARPGWSADQGDLGFVEPAAAGTSDMICHKSATAGQSSIAVTAGETITVQWNTWPESHKGPVLDYLADCGGDCTAVDKEGLKFFKIAERGLVDATTSTWAADELMANSNQWEITIPADIASGSYVLRHEILALHSAGAPNGAQFYPQCINIDVTRGGSAKPSGVSGTSLYKQDDAGVVFNIYGATEYPIPGPPLYSAAQKQRRHPKDVHA